MPRATTRISKQERETIVSEEVRFYLDGRDEIITRGQKAAPYSDLNIVETLIAVVGPVRAGGVSLKVRAAMVEQAMVEINSYVFTTEYP